MDGESDKINWPKYCPYIRNNPILYGFGQQYTSCTFNQSTPFGFGQQQVNSTTTNGNKFGVTQK
jgi:hypothetical protein